MAVAPICERAGRPGGPGDRSERMRAKPGVLRGAPGNPTTPKTKRARTRGGGAILRMRGLPCEKVHLLRSRGRRATPCVCAAWPATACPSTLHACALMGAAWKQEPRDAMHGCIGSCPEAAHVGYYESTVHINCHAGKQVFHLNNAAGENEGSWPWDRHAAAKGGGGRDGPLPPWRGTAASPNPTSSRIPPAHRVQALIEAQPSREQNTHSPLSQAALQRSSAARALPPAKRMLNTHVNEGCGGPTLLAVLTGPP